MCSAPAPSPSDRRYETGLQFDPASGRMQLGTFSAALGTGYGNREVLNTYVELTARSRGDRVANVIEVRQADVEALAAALDLDADDLAAEIEAVLGATRAAAISMVSRLKGSRVIGGLTKAATAGLLDDSLVDDAPLAPVVALAPARVVDAPVAPDAAWDPVVDGPA